MATTDNLQQKIETARKQGYSDAQISNFLGAKGVDKATISTALAVPAPVAEQSPTYAQGVKEAFAGGINKVKEAQADTTAASQERIPNALKAVEAGAKAGAGVIEAVSSPLAPIFSPVGKVLAKLSGAISDIPAVQRFADSKAGEVASRVAEDVSNLSVIAGTVAGGKATPKVATAVKTAATNTADKAKSVVASTKPLITPVKSADQAIGQIAQGGTDAIQPVKSALETIDTKGVTTFKELQARIDSAIPELSRKVDTELSADTGIYKLEDLAVKAETKGGTPVSTDYISRALNDLTLLYDAIGDAVKLGNVKELLETAKATGLTRKDVNDISRLYGQEFGSKAFSKIGEPLTSTNAQAFENTRKGLKSVARQGLGGDEAKLIDSKLSDLYDTKTLIDKNVEAVNKLQQRINARGLIEKAGYLLAKYADILTGGSLRGFVGGILPRGAGYKVMNALDIEQALRKNLDIVEKALNQKTDEAMIKTLQSELPSRQ